MYQGKLELKRHRHPLEPLEDRPPPYPQGYLEHRRGEYALYDQLPAWARKVLRRTNHEVPVAYVHQRLNRGDRPVDIIADIEHTEKALSQNYLKQFER